MCPVSRYPPPVEVDFSSAPWCHWPFVSGSRTATNQRHSTRRTSAPTSFFCRGRSREGSLLLLQVRLFLRRQRERERERERGAEKEVGYVLVREGELTTKPSARPTGCHDVIRWFEIAPEAGSCVLHFFFPCVVVLWSGEASPRCQQYMYQSHKRSNDGRKKKKRVSFFVSFFYPRRIVHYLSKTERAYGTRKRRRRRRRRERERGRERERAIAGPFLEET